MKYFNQCEIQITESTIKDNNKNKLLANKIGYYL